MVKRRDAPYAPGQRNGAWIKVKNFRTQEVVIGGWTAGKGNLEALLVGIPDGEHLRYAGKVATGFDDRERAELLAQLEPLAAGETPFATRLTRAESALAHFVRPSLVGEVQFGEWTSDGRLRHPSWRGLRADKEPSEVVRES